MEAFLLDQHLNCSWQSMSCPFLSESRFFAFENVLEISSDETMAG
ncbi:hypothetical protein RV13_GL001240 [Enterococcus raffinosus]|nr:hypothetical protein RV13_GL001240 [Enterococcus raffinosus]